VGAGLVPALRSEMSQGLKPLRSDDHTGADLVSARGVILRVPDPFDLTTAQAAVLRLQSWLPSASSRATIEVSVDDDATWDVVQIVPPSDTWIPIEVDLDAYLGQRI